ncbi:MAG: hypothetical protein ACSHXD_02495 [Marinosulfonomonas sp.]
MSDTATDLEVAACTDLPMLRGVRMAAITGLSKTFNNRLDFERFF